jgi:hypothetical protein
VERPTASGPDPEAHAGPGPSRAARPPRPCPPTSTAACIAGSGRWWTCSSPRPDVNERSRRLYLYLHHAAGSANASEREAAVFARCCSIRWSGTRQAWSSKVWRRGGRAGRPGREARGGATLQVLCGRSGAGRRAGDLRPERRAGSWRRCRSCWASTCWPGPSQLRRVALVHGSGLFAQAGPTKAAAAVMSVLGLSDGVSVALVAIVRRRHRPLHIATSRDTEQVQGPSRARPPASGYASHRLRHHVPRSRCVLLAPDEPAKMQVKAWVPAQRAARWVRRTPARRVRLPTHYVAHWFEVLTSTVVAPSGSGPSRRTGGVLFWVCRWIAHSEWRHADR